MWMSLHDWQTYTESPQQEIITNWQIRHDRKQMMITETGVKYAAATLVIPETINKHTNPLVLLTNRMAPVLNDPRESISIPWKTTK